MQQQKHKNERSIRRLLVANRSEIACRILRTAREMKLETVAVYSQADENALHVRKADRAVALGGRTPAESYLDVDKILEAARSSGADAVHPGYGFLAENAAFARAVGDAGLIFVGPSPECIESMGDKLRARELAETYGLPMIPSASLGESEAEAVRAAARLGYPVLVKAVGGGGGRGMRAVADGPALSRAVTAARREAEAAFGDARLYLEKRIRRPRHIEVQIFGDGRGGAVAFGERECSMQRRHQKVIEESPAAGLDPSLRGELIGAALTLARGLAYSGAGTVEFITDEGGGFYFLEMNTRLQVEHAVTEMITRTDMVRLQLETACGSMLAPPPAPVGHAIECRVYAEDPATEFLPTSGRVLLVDHPRGAGIRVDSALYDGIDIPIEYDPMLAKVVAWAPDRDQCIERMIAALQDFALLGVTTNIAFLIDVLEDKAFAEGDYSTETLERRFADWKPLAASEPTGKRIDMSAVALALLVDQAGAGGSPSVGGTRGLRDTPGPWQSLGAWRLGRAGPRSGVEIVSVGPRSLRFKADGRLREVPFVRNRGRLLFWVDGAALEFSASDDDDGRSDTHTDGFSPQVRAPMPGKVSSVEVEAGQELGVDDPLVLMEAMKMETTLRAAAPCRVLEVRVQTGQSVAQDEVLLVLEQITDESASLSR